MVDAAAPVDMEVEDMVEVEAVPFWHSSMDGAATWTTFWEGHLYIMRRLFVQLIQTLVFNIGYPLVADHNIIIYKGHTMIKWYTNKTESSLVNPGRADLRAAELSHVGES